MAHSTESGPGRLEQFRQTPWASACHFAGKHRRAAACSKALSRLKESGNHCRMEAQTRAGFPVLTTPRLPVNAVNPFSISAENPLHLRESLCKRANLAQIKHEPCSCRRSGIVPGDYGTPGKHLTAKQTNQLIRTQSTQKN